MLFRCNILALVGGGRSPRYSPNKVMIWDDHQSRCIGELSFRVEVRAVRLRRDRVVVVLEHKIYVYNFADLKILHQTDTVSNPLGLCALSPTQDNTVMACPGLNKGQVRVELYDLNVTKFISAHDGELAQLQLTLDGALLATASEKGTLIRVYDTARATLMHEFRRGADRRTRRASGVAATATEEEAAAVVGMAGTRVPTRGCRLAGTPGMVPRAVPSRRVVDLGRAASTPRRRFRSSKVSSRSTSAASGPWRSSSSRTSPSPSWRSAPSPTL